MSQKIHLRRAIPEDAKKLSILYKTVYIHAYGFEGVSDEYANFIEEQFAISYLESKIRENLSTQIVACLGDNLVGVCEVIDDHMNPIDKIERPELSKLYILEPFCRKGIGRRLVQEAETVLSEKGFQEYWLWVWALNPNAILFYENMGFIAQGNVSFQMEKNAYDNLVMLKKLRP